MRAEDKDLIWHNIFQFPSDGGQVESVIWRAKAPDLDVVHKFGCEKQASDRAKGRARSTYIGAITGNVGEIRSLKNGAASLTVVYKPDEGDAHAHVGFTPNATKADRNALKVLLRSKFGPLEAHTCP
jgi:hypothetical protein